MTRWICTTELDSRFPYAVGTLYVGRCRGLYPWLHRRPGVGGGRGRYLWIDAAAFNAWARAKGIRFRFEIGTVHEAVQEAEAEAQH